MNKRKATLYVPKDSYAKYVNGDVWKDFSYTQKIETLVSSIKLKKTIKLKKGKTKTLVAKISPKDVTISDVVWESSNLKVAKVDQYGAITALNPGTAIITATSTDGSGVSASCKVIVK